MSEVFYEARRFPGMRGFIRTVTMQIEWLFVDVDGVLTDGHLYYGDNGSIFRAFSIYDGMAVVIAKKAGLGIGVISGRSDPGTRRRLEEWELEEIHLGVEDKTSVVRSITEQRKVPFGRCAYLGDDINDLSPMKLCGYRMTVPNGADAVKRIADWISPVPGGQGVLRRAVIHILERNAQVENTI